MLKRRSWNICNWLPRRKSTRTHWLNYETQLQDALQYAVSNKELYDNLKSGLNQEITIKNKIEQTKLQIENIHKKEGIYRDELDEFVKRWS
jgi:DNA sulfur modification protein DndD